MSEAIQQIIVDHQEADFETGTTRLNGHRAPYTARPRCASGRAGLVTSVSSGVLVNAGHLLENLVFVARCAARRRTSAGTIRVVPAWRFLLELG